MQAFFYIKKKTASESPFLETRTFRLHRNRRIASGDSDVFRAAPAVCIINTVRCLALYFETVLRCFKKVAECAAFLLVEAAAAGIAFILRRLSFYQMVFLQQQFSALCIHPVTLQSSFVMIFPPVF